ncbi:hypothetical protein D9613_011759 [Agrocybe pediades]|uniref:DUF6533 domain-containing protein n=1 Tax=Agrocybe pediades TaxID=84607 RepID=A0A8H4QKB9_9AGAR|nr:hypothetical protein D9613_011759 [Agrocybe pediades]
MSAQSDLNHWMSGNFSKSVMFWCFSALIAQVWDALISFSDEVEYLWRGKFTRIKALYCVARYLLLISQIIGQISFFGFENRLSSVQKICSMIYLFKCVFSQVAVMTLEMVLAIRIYALYNRSLKAKRFLVTAFMICSSLEMVGIGYMIRSSSGERAICDSIPKTDSTGITLIGLGVGTSQFLAFIATVANLIMRDRAGFSRTPLTSLILWEGVTTFTLVTIAISIMVLTELIRIKTEHGAERALWLWYIAVLSLVASRLILNMRKLKLADHEAHEQEAGDSICLTTLDDL